MPHYILYAFVDEADLKDIAGALEARFRQFVSNRRWIARAPTVVNQYYGATVITETGLEELWELGLALELPEIGVEFPKWFSDIVAIAQFLGVLHRELGRTFSLGFVDSERGRHESLFDVSTDPSETGKLPVIEGVRYIA